MPSLYKVTAVRALHAEVQAADGVVVLEHFGITGPEMSAIRMQLAARGARLRLHKNSLTRRALIGTPAAALSPFLGGPTMLLVAPSDGHGALRWAVDHIRRAIPLRQQEAWDRYLSDPEGARARWIGAQRGAQNWTPLPKPGALLRVRAAWLGGDVLDAEQALAEAALRPEEVYLRLLHTIQAPARQLCAAIQAGPQKLQRLLEAHRAQVDAMDS